MSSTRLRPAERIRRAPVQVILAVYAVVIAYPLLWMVISSFKSSSEIFADPWGLPSVWLVQNYAAAWDRGISDYFLNSVIVTVISTAATVALAALCAYGMVRLSSRVANVVLIVAMGGLVVAPQVSLIPLYRLLDTMGLLNTYWAMILPYVAFRLPMAILLIRSVFLGIPRELEDAATIDGCRSFGVFRHVYLPLSASVLTTAAVLTGYFAWNEFLFAIVYIDADALRTIPAGLMSFRDSLSTEWGVLLAGLTIAALPIVVVFLALQRYFVAGVAAGSVKG
ncbi:MULTISPECIES: carbohydrate ABC transporter permease [Microbacterium]|uniref:carbohydrate ABC transporter permease n=1 Tax=Microbacterium TaxID=33882 RepID=UPI00076AFB49|nr:MULTISPECIES: carbohydrate ABC transporter permease [Microbacterium]MPT15530.1 carbohydrate ABC transporter permease [Microbacterium sp.]AMG82423.1 ABC transporter permease [Microbacterium sp. PAMC 28756]MCK2032570.1 carbohydrate ABC transporter permease [Microbacterium sp. KSW4-4]OSP05411.1 ABC transporter permease [Microbacterium sp. LEMMJ01]QXE29271.1 carbohydrate ABC transporter permease [Microbacterium paraoxydans]